MENYLVDRETLGQFVDGLISQKYKNTPPKNFDTLRDELIEKLDNKIALSLFNDLSDPELDEVNEMLDDEKTPPEAFLNFFRKAGVNLQQKTSSAIAEFKAEFLGGKNA